METFKVSKKRILILIPARYASTRFPGKPLAKIHGISMIQRVLENCSKAQSVGFEFEAFVVTDDQKVEEHIQSFSPNVVRVDDDVPTGTQRIELAFKRFFKDKNFDLIINVQGDEPLLGARDIEKLAQFHLNSSFHIATLVKKQLKFDQVFHDYNKVKVVMSEISGAAFYFSRAAIPHRRDSHQNRAEDLALDYWFLHIGVYSFRPDSLLQLTCGSETRLEHLEKLEQLRALEMGLTIGAIQIESDVIGVDRLEDILKVEEVLNGRQ